MGRDATPPVWAWRIATALAGIGFTLWLTMVHADISALQAKQTTQDARAADQQEALGRIDERLKALEATTQNNTAALQRIEHLLMNGTVPRRSDER